MEQNSNKKNLSIEGLRGVVILIIVMFHIIYRFNQLYSVDIDINFFGISKWGDIGRVIFLVISSYFLFNKKLDKNFNLKLYWKRKFIRLWPSYFISITLTFIITNLFFLPNRTYGFFEYLVNIVFINGFIGYPYIDGGHWYLTTLISFIIIYGVFKKLKINNNISTYMWWIILVLSIKILTKILSIKFLEFLFKFSGGEYVGIACCGILLHMFIEGVVDTKSKRIKASITFIIALIYSFILAGLWQFIGLIIGLIAVFTCFKRPIKVLKSKILLFFGTISYQLYLCHQNIAYVIEYNLVQITDKWSIFYAAIAFIVCICIANLLFKFERSYINKLK